MTGERANLSFRIQAKRNVRAGHVLTYLKSFRSIRERGPSAIQLCFTSVKNMEAKVDIFKDSHFWRKTTHKNKTSFKTKPLKSNFQFLISNCSVLVPFHPVLFRSILGLRSIIRFHSVLGQEHFHPMFRSCSRRQEVSKTKVLQKRGC